MPYKQLFYKDLSCNYNNSLLHNVINVRSALNFKVNIIIYAAP